MRQPEAIIFDLDGTLIHSAPDIHAAVNVALGEIGRRPLELDEVTRFIGNGVEKLISRCLNATGDVNDALEAGVLRRFLSAYAKDSVTLTRPYPGVISCLEELHRSGVPLGICTNKPQDAALEICDLLELTGYFTVISGATPGVAKKPDPAPLLTVAKQLRASPHKVIYVGDSVVDYQTALAAQVPFRLFDGGYLNAPLPDLDARYRFEHWPTNGFHL